MSAPHEEAGAAEAGRRRRRAWAVAAVAGVALVISALMNSAWVEQYLYRRELAQHLIKTEDALLHWGSPHARLKVQAYLPFDCLCQGDRMRVLSDAARRYGDRIYIELVNMDSRLGARQFADSGLKCSGLFLNGRQRVTIDDRGKPREVYFSGSPAEENPTHAYYTSEQLAAAIDQEMQRLYGPQAAAPAPKLLIPLEKRPGAPKPEEARAPDLDAQAFDDLAQTLFAPVYPLLAKQIVEDYGITDGLCLDVGCGPAYLSLELARLTRLRIIALDIEPRALALARANASKAGLADRVLPTKGDVHQLPFAADHFDLVVSRCSLPCWQDKVQAFREINRVLKPNAVAFIGLGSGRLLPERERQRIVRTLDELRRRHGEDVPWLKSVPSTRFLQYVVMKAGLGDAKITRTTDGVWVEFRKHPASAPARR